MGGWGRPMVVRTSRKCRARQGPDGRSARWFSRSCHRADRARDAAGKRGPGRVAQGEAMRLSVGSLGPLSANHDESGRRLGPSRGEPGWVCARFDFPCRMAMIAACANPAASLPTGARSASSRAADPGSPGEFRARARATPSRRRLEIRLTPASTHSQTPATDLCVSRVRGRTPTDGPGADLRLEPWLRRTRRGIENPENRSNRSNRRLFHRRTRRSTTS